MQKTQPIPHSGIQNALAPRKIRMPYRTWQIASTYLRMFGYDPYNSATAADIHRAVISAS